MPLSARQAARSERLERALQLPEQHAETGGDEREAEHDEADGEAFAAVRRGSEVAVADGCHRHHRKVQRVRPIPLLLKAVEERADGQVAREDEQCKPAKDGGGVDGLEGRGALGGGGERLLAPSHPTTEAGDDVLHVCVCWAGLQRRAVSAVEDENDAQGYDTGPTGGRERVTF